MNVYYPDVWKIVKIESNNGVIYKVLCGFNTGYYTWRLNSGIEEFDIRSYDLFDSISYVFYGNSGSEYVCNSELEGFSNLTKEIFDNFKNKENYLNEYKISEITFDDFLKEFKISK